MSLNQSYTQVTHGRSLLLGCNRLASAGLGKGGPAQRASVCRTEALKV
jgi:hypothetical protein